MRIASRSTLKRGFQVRSVPMSNSTKRSYKIRTKGSTGCDGWETVGDVLKSNIDSLQVLSGHLAATHGRPGRYLSKSKE